MFVYGDDARGGCISRYSTLTGADIVDVAYYAASAPAHVRGRSISSATHQGSGSVIHAIDSTIIRLIG